MIRSSLPSSILVLFALAAPRPSLTAGDPAEPPLLSAMLLREGGDLLKKKDHQAAFEALDHAAVLAPKDPAIAKALAEAQKELLRDLTRREEEARKKGDGKESARCLARIGGLSLGDKKVEASLKKAGLVFCAGEWRPAKEAEERSAREAKQAAEFLERLKLGSRFKLHEGDRIRLFTDLDQNRKAVIDTYTQALDAHCRNFRWLFRRHLKGPRTDERLDIILFQDQSAFVRFRDQQKGSGSRIGFYSGSAGTVVAQASDTLRELFLFSTYQMENRWLGALEGSWAGFGLAYYFGGSASDWRKGTAAVGTVDRVWHSLAKNGLRREAAFPAFQDLLKMEGFDPSHHPRFSPDAMRGSAWGHVYFLLDGDPRSRESFFGALDAAVGNGGRGAGGNGAFRGYLSKALNLPQADADFAALMGKL